MQIDEHVYAMLCSDVTSMYEYVDQNAFAPATVRIGVFGTVLI